MVSTARSLAAHHPPIRRQSVSYNPIGGPNPFIQQANTNLSPMPPPTTVANPKMAQGRVMGVQGDSNLSQAPALTL